MSWVICDNCKFIFLIVGKGPRIVIILGARQSKLFSLATVGHMGLFPCYIIFHSLHDTLETCKGHFCRKDAIFLKEKRRVIYCHQRCTIFTDRVLNLAKWCNNFKWNRKFLLPFLVSFSSLYYSDKYAYISYLDTYYWYILVWRVFMNSTSLILFRFLGGL